jgi:hypothetical protein
MLSVIDTYLLVKESEGRAKSTIYEYRLYLSAFAAHCNKPLAEVTNTDIAAWVVGERAKGLADASILGRVKSLRVFFNWCVANDILVKSPLKMKNPRIRRTHPRIATVTSIARLLKGEAIVQSPTLKARVSRFFTSLDTAKECLKRKLYPLLHVLQDLGVNLPQHWLSGFPFGQQLVSVIQAEGLARFLVGVFTNRQRVIVDPTAKLKHSFKACSLGASWEKAVLVCQSHRCIVP